LVFFGGLFILFAFTLEFFEKEGEVLNFYLGITLWKNGPPFFSSQNPFGEPLPLRETFLDEWLNVPGKDGIFPKDLSFAPRCRPKKSFSFIFLL